MTREQMIYECLKKLPYPVSFYDKIHDGSLYSIWHKHVQLGIPIDKKQRKYKESNDLARKEQQANAAPEYQQISIDEYMRERDREEQQKPISAAEYARRCLNRGEVNFITIHVFGEGVCRDIVDSGLTVEEYYSIMEPQAEVEPYVYYNEGDGCYYRKTDGCGYMLMTDEEMEDFDISSQPIGLIEDQSLQQGPRLVKKPGK